MMNGTTDKQPSERAMRCALQILSTSEYDIEAIEDAARIIDRHTDSMAEELAEALREAEVVLQVVYENAMKAEFFKTAKAMMGPLTKMRTTLAKFDAMKGKPPGWNIETWQAK
jgi:aspartate/tyrosine/aromatic aminotransferase